MKIDCPSCSATYQIADSAIGEKGRNLRCAACGHYWFQKPEGASEIADAAPNPKLKVTKETRNKFEKAPFAPSIKAPAHLQMRQKAHEKIKLGQIAAIGAGWLGAIAIFAGILITLVLNRTTIVTKWPKSASLFEILGAPVNLYGLNIENVELRSGIDETGPRLIISGNIINKSNSNKALPYIRVNLTDNMGKVVATWLVDPSATVIEKGQTIQFQSVRRNPPSGNLHAKIQFADAPKDLKEGEGAHTQPAEHGEENSLLLGTAAAPNEHGAENNGHEPAQLAGATPIPEHNDTVVSQESGQKALTEAPKADAHNPNPAHEAPKAEQHGQDQTMVGR